MFSLIQEAFPESWRWAQGMTVAEVQPESRKPGLERCPLHIRVVVMVLEAHQLFKNFWALLKFECTQIYLFKHRF